jgi:polyisoprenoid-binding protein YceI
MASEQITTPARPEPLSNATLAGEWVLDPARSTVSLANRSIWGLAPVKGVFRQVTGSGTVSPTGTVKGVITVAAASVDTKNTRRDNHLRSADFFDIGCYPDIAFTAEDVRSTGPAVRPSGQGVSVTGTLRVRGQARPLTFDATAAIHGEAEVRLDAAVDIHQADFGLAWNFLRTISARTTITVHAVFISH